MLTKDENQKTEQTEILVNINIGTHQLYEIQNIVDKVAYIEKQYNVNCIQVHLTIQG